MRIQSAHFYGARGPPGPLRRPGAPDGLTEPVEEPRAATQADATSPRPVSPETELAVLEWLVQVDPTMRDNERYIARRD